MTGLFISYSHSDGARAASALAASLRRLGFDVWWDDDLPAAAPLSIPSWMEEGFRDRTVVVVVSPDYLRALESNDFLERKGVRYEARLLRHKLYHHGEAYRCGVVPVVPAGFDKNRLPAVLQSLVIHTFDPDTGAGLEELVNALTGAGAVEGGVTMSVEPFAASRNVREMLRDLEDLDPAEPAALVLVERLVGIGAGDIELARSFDSVVGAAKAHGDVDLVRRTSEMCLRTLSATERLRGEGALEAKILVEGQAWYLLREHRLVRAAAAAEDGTRIAEKYRDLYTAARGTLCHATVFLRMAGEGVAFDRDFYLRKSEHLLLQAIDRFSAISGRASEEVGLCASLSAEWWLARHHLTGDRANLATAVSKARSAEVLLTPGGEWYHWLMVLRARLCHAARKYNDGREFVTQVIAANAYPEVVARAHHVRAELSLGSREKASAVRDFLVAEEKFRALRYDYAAASSWWSVAKLDAARVTDVKLTAADIDDLEDLTPDPRTRRRAVLEYEQASARRFGRRCPPDWRFLVDRVRYA
ncbi:TIR domain-containing protein [Lentzea sp. DG1S-22]|uniref:TIR domain-containing protein n=1 Tax=Lentzea sp. DG1S-22 TaxID=3108822 RepID=UPI002E77DD82|nr:TIR domain-containing protein [Lentzea sp. DG1S-22]WVH80671.1 TIR domain-containing protein [Lentzea sp. DG1S-22]